MKKLVDVSFIDDEEFVDIKQVTNSVPDFQKDYRCAVIIMPPQEVWDPIQVTRKKFDKSFVRWMPHINLLFPFAPNRVFPDVVEILREELINLEPFEITFSEYSYFDHGKKATVWLSPEPKDLVVRLQGIIESVFPTCDDLSNRSTAGFTPHLTVGQFPMSTIDRLLGNYNNEWNEMTFLCEYVHLISRTGTDPFEIRYSVPLGGGEIIIGELLVEKPIDNSRSLFIRNLSFQTTENEIRDFFTEHGFTVTNVVLPMQNNKPKGFAFVTISEDRSLAIQALDGQMLRGRGISVNLKN